MAGDGIVVSADKKVVKLWDRNTVRAVLMFFANWSNISLPFWSPFVSLQRTLPQ